MWELIEDAFAGLFWLIGCTMIALLIAGFGYRFIYVAGPTVQAVPQSRAVQAKPRCTANDVQILQFSLQPSPLSSIPIPILKGFVDAIGEVKNNCAHAIGPTYVQITFRDAARKIVAVDTVTCPEMRINPGERCSFSGPVSVGSYATTETKVLFVPSPLE
jgi:hypothetical protein